MRTPRQDCKTRHDGARAGRGQLIVADSPIPPARPSTRPHFGGDWIIYDCWPHYDPDTTWGMCYLAYARPVDAPELADVRPEDCALIAFDQGGSPICIPEGSGYNERMMDMVRRAWCDDD